MQWFDLRIEASGLRKTAKTGPREESAFDYFGLR